MSLTNIMIEIIEYANISTNIKSLDFANSYSQFEEVSNKKAGKFEKIKDMIEMYKQEAVISSISEALKGKVNVI